jgi:hypothetical protein
MCRSTERFLRGEREKGYLNDRYLAIVKIFLNEANGKDAEKRLKYSQNQIPQ